MHTAFGCLLELCVIQCRGRATCPYTNLIKQKGKAMDRIYKWLFSEEERTPIGYIAVFGMIILFSTVISLFVVAVDRHMEGWINYLFN
jgi:hypothetical protein